MRRFVLMALTAAISLVAAGSAQAVVVNVNANSYGVALVAGTLPTAGPGLVVPGTTIPIAGAAVSTCDPWLSPDLLQPTQGLCWHGGAVMHGNETFAVAWDPGRAYWQTTKNYIEQYLRDVADGSGTLTSPYAVTTQYADGNPDSKDSRNTIGRAENASIYGGGCVDYGSQNGGSTCQFGDTTGSGLGTSYVKDCQAALSGTNQFSENPDGTFGPAPNDTCITDAQVRTEVTAMVGTLQGQFKPGYTPTVVVLTPPGVEVCLDSADTLCSASAGSTAQAQFCSYHSQVAGVAYIVQPWTASWHLSTGCDEPDAPLIPDVPTSQELATDVGMRLVSPLSQAQIAAIVNPSMDGWFSSNGAEINDNGCVRLGNGRDAATVGASTQNPYLLQREFNNAGAIQTDPNALKCTPSVALAPTFVAPSAVNPGDVVEFDGSTTVSSLIVPKGNYTWTFGDGTTAATGPSVSHSYTAGGTYTVKLTVTDRGANSASLSQTVDVLGANGKPVTPPKTPGQTNTALQARLLIMPQGLRGLLRSGLHLRVISNQAADGFVTLSITRGAAKRAHIKTGRGPTVVVGRGTVSGVTDGTVNLQVMFSRGMAKKLGHLRHVTLTVRLVLAAAGGAHVAVDAAGRY